ncbi:hypothetical protein BSK59_16080 [Paenibacillus odorifer]|uniref:RNA 2'-phosphotransferase n=1 Tax=Paenibacillus odorifer TaxID=189426 RepID=UPI00096C3C9E|nr:RNA 2'-phosphotransferase [Paenibacillus odorifer]OME54098.1 hypothetical protein BSK59_16080 [Paenibacillus odorifer]
MDKKTELSLSKFISKVLRHEAKRFGLDQDEDNFVNLTQFIQVIRQEFTGSASIVDIQYLLTSSEKQGIKRFQIEGDKVRATYKHTWKKGKQLNDNFTNDEL